MTVTTDSFRVDFPEFADDTKYTDAQIAFWLALAAVRLDPNRWVDLLDFGTELFVAHNLVIATRNQTSAGGQLAPITGKTVDKVSVQYDVSRVTLDDAGLWNATNYGIQFWQLVQMVGAGGVQL